MINLEIAKFKTYQGWWNCVVKGEPTIDTSNLVIYDLPKSEEPVKRYTIDHLWGRPHPNPAPSILDEVKIQRLYLK